MASSRSHIASLWHHDSAMLLWTLIPASKWSGQSRRVKIEKWNQDERWYQEENLDTFERGLKSGIEKDFQKENDRFPSRLNIIAWILYVYYIVDITYLRSRVRTRSFLCQTWLWYQYWPYHTPLPKIRWSGVTTSVSDVYMRGKHPTYTN